MTYREIQKYNSENLSPKLNRRRKKFNLTNRGWANVIKLYEWIQSSFKTSSHHFRAAMDCVNKFLQAEANMQKITDKYQEKQHVQI